MRKLAEGFIPHWAGVAADPQNPEVEAGRKYTETGKIVFTKTLSGSKWTNTTLASGDITYEVNSLKRKEGGDIIAYGGATFASSLIKNNLIDEYHLFINSAALGSGLPIFKQRTNLKLKSSQTFDCRIVVLVFTPL
ncbi:dihydrofolate reductase family protein [Fulvivirgaceae bacterium BMA12]|uniref:Dihydrofolate reductase family protein n=1 Tax=Agaribacillus aureus TaxID=3051825 RepID=A0ABT8L4Z3_9BACT|nr:dihydrofolate reductase family protein [Fulvivirgaceae bacterium BMA12]